MDPATIALIVAGLRAAIEGYNAIERANKGLTEDQRTARRLLRKELVAQARAAGQPLHPGESDD